MKDHAIHPETSLGYVSLKVSNLRRSLAFYEDVIGFRSATTSESTASLGTGGNVLLELVEVEDGRRVPNTAGLYHFAILTPSRRDLAASLRQLLHTRTPLQGFADHLVSEAVYLADPDGNGIEIYRDRPRAEWPYREGIIVMGTEPLDVNDLLSEPDGHREPWSGLAPETRIGHIHLQVSNLIAAEQFYQRVLGFDLVMRYGPSATFLSAGGYHHHIGCNTWAGVNVPAAPHDATGLNWYTIDFPDQETLQDCVRSVIGASLAVNEQQGGYLVHDPSGNGILLREKP